MALTIERFMFESFREIQEADKQAAHQAHDILTEGKPDGDIDSEKDAQPAITEDDLSAAKEVAYGEGYQAGHAAGVEEATSQQAEIDKQIAEMLPKVTNSLAEADVQYQELLHEQTEGLSRLALTIAKKIAGNAIKEDPIAEIEALVKECVTSLIEEPTVAIYAHPDITQLLKQRLETMLEKMPSLSIELSVEGDAEIAAGDCRIEWTNGSAERNTDKLWEDVALIVNQRYEKSSGSDNLPEAATATTDTPSVTADKDITPDNSAVNMQEAEEPTTIDTINKEQI